MERITITIDGELLTAIDSLVERRGYSSRSEAIRELLREAAKPDHTADEEAPCLATLTYVYDHSVRELSRRMVSAQHEHHDLGIATTHVHFDHDSCLEVAILRGPAGAVRGLADSLTAQRGVRYACLHVIPLGDPAQGPHRSPGSAPCGRGVP